MPGERFQKRCQNGRNPFNTRENRKPVTPGNDPGETGLSWRWRESNPRPTGLLYDIYKLSSILLFTLPRSRNQPRLRYLRNCCPGNPPAGRPASPDLCRFTGHSERHLREPSQRYAAKAKSASLFSLAVNLMPGLWSVTTPLQPYRQRSSSRIQCTPLMQGAVINITKKRVFV